MESSRSVRLVEKANKPTAPSELLGIYRKFGDYPVSRHGAQALWGRETMAGMAGMVGRRSGRAYGMPVAQGGAMHFDLGVYANRRESPSQGTAEHGVFGQLTARW